MSYENAPATKLIATSCCNCGRPLLDAKSVEIGMGPDCRKKFMDSVVAPEEARKEANSIVHYVAANQDSPDVGACFAQLMTLGFHKLAVRLSQRLIPVEITVLPNGDMVVRAPYKPSFIEDTRKLPGRWWRAEDKTTKFSAAAKPGLWQALKSNFSGVRALGPNGFFTI